jgi:hypothetical protein
MNGESASNGLEGLSEFTDFDGTEAIEVEVLEDLLDGSALILSTVGALADLLEDNVNALGTAGVRNSSLVGGETPGLDDHVDEVSFLLVGHDSIDISVVTAEVFAGDGTVSGSSSEELAEVVENGFGLLLAAGDSRVSGSVVFVDEGLELASLGSSADLFPGGLDDGKSLVRHVGLQAQ